MTETDPDAEQTAPQPGDAVEQPTGKWEGLFPKKHPLVLLYTGNGKGKTTSALGVTRRAWGRAGSACSSF